MTKQLNKKHLSQLGLLVATSWMLMGNTQCQKQEERVLKKNISISGMEASDFLDSSSFSFSEVAQSQLSGVISDSKYFYERSIYPNADGGLVALPNVSGKISSKLAAKVAAINQKTTSQLKTWFPNLKTESMTLSGESSCLVSKPQHLFYGKINALEAYSGTLFQFGFSQTVTPLAPSASFSMDKMRMDLTFKAINPWTSQIQKSVNAEAFKKDYKAGFGIDLGIIHIGPEFYRVTGMSEVTLKGLTAGVSDLATALLATDRQEWQTRVLYNLDTNVVIVGGAELGLKKGDKLKIENEAHTWQGTPCSESGVLLGSVSKTSDPWIVEIVDAGDLISNAKILNPKEDDSIEVGALVRIQQLYVESASGTATTSSK